MIFIKINNEYISINSISKIAYTEMNEIKIYLYHGFVIIYRGVLADRVFKLIKNQIGDRIMDIDNDMLREEYGGKEGNNEKIDKDIKDRVSKLII